jgi:large exoprotein involved in heme utilization and adhesion
MINDNESLQYNSGQALRLRSGQAGFVLLISSIVISVILVAVVFSISFSGFFTRFNLLDGYNKEASLELANACGEIAVLKLIQDNTYSGNETLDISSDSCTVLLISPGSYEINTTADKGGAVSNVKINLDTSYNVIRWREVATL